VSYIRTIKQSVCQHCGQAMPEVQEFGLHLTPGERLVLEAVQRSGAAGISHQRLWQACYEGRGPQSENAISVILSKLNKKLRTVGRRIYCDRHRPTRWRLIEEGLRRVK